MESIPEESKLLYDILKSETTEIYEAKWASYRARATAAAATARSTTRSTTPLRAPSGTASGEPSSATSMPTSALVVPRASSGEAAISTATPAVASIRAASYTRTPAGAALLDSTPGPVLSSTTATAPTTPATSGVIPTTKHDSTKGDLSPEARHLYDLPVGDSATATSAAPRCDRSSAVPIGGIPEPAAATATLERDLRSVTPSTCSTVCVRVDTSATSTLSSPLASSASITASPMTVAAALVSPLLDSCDHITAPPAICLILRPNATIDTGVSEACSINLVLAPGASALLAAFLVDNVETTKHTENRLQPWPPPRYATFLEENMCKDRPQVLLWHWFVVESMQLMFWAADNPCPPPFPNISTVFCFASSRILNLHSTLDKLQLSGDCQVFWTCCYIAYLHWSPGVITLAFPDWKMLYSSIETWVNVNSDFASVHFQWAITLQLSTSSGASLVILNERAEVQHLYTWTRVLSVAVCKGGIYHHILGVNPHYSVLMKCSFSRSQLQSEIQISTAGHILFIRCALVQWNNPSAISGVSVHFWFQYCSAGLHGCEKFQWTIAWFLSYHSSLCSLQIRSAGAILLVQQNCPAIVDSKLFSVMRALRLDAAHKLLTDMPNVSTFVPWPPPSTHAGPQLIHGQYSFHHAQQKRGKNVLVVWALQLSLPPTMQDFEDNQGKWSAIWFEARGERHQFAGIIVVKLKPPWPPSLGMSMKPPAGDAVTRCHSCAIVGLAPVCLQLEQLTIVQFAAMELVLDGYDSMYLTGHFIQRAYFLMQWKIPWLFSCSIVGVWVLFCPTRKTFLSSFAEFQGEITRSFDMAIVEGNTWTSGDELHSSIEIGKFCDLLVDMGINSKSSHYLEVHILDATLIRLSTSTSLHARELYWLHKIYSSCYQFVTQVGHWKFNFALLFCWDVTSTIDSVTAIKYIPATMLLLSSALSQALVFYRPVSYLLHWGSKLMIWGLASSRDGILAYTKRVLIAWDPGGSYPLIDAVNGSKWNSTQMQDLHQTWDPGGYTQHRLEGKPELKEGGLSATCPLLHCWAGQWAAALGPGLAEDINSYYKYVGDGQNQPGLELDGLDGGFGRGLAWLV